MKGDRIVVSETVGASSGAGILEIDRAAPPIPLPAQRALTFALLLSALRCTAQYVVLPFVLPWIGVAAAIPPWVTLCLGAVALGCLTRNVRALWRMRHARRWSYLLTALAVAAALVLFTVVDVRALLHR